MFYLIEGTIYPFDILYVCEKTDEEVFNYIEKRKKYILSKEEKDALILTGVGKCTRLRNKSVVLRLSQKPKTPDTIATLSHEALHAVGFHFESMGITYDTNNDEPWTYYLMYIIKTVLRLYGK